MAKNIADLIIAKRLDDRLKWNEDGSVRLIIGEILPKDFTPKQTLEGRRRRFSMKVEELLAPYGWKRLQSNHYAPPVS